ncbi:MAG: hypothetical protein CL912_30215 [Deltaproteobacteria bacterium]|nr:hypothetical protein [Deltaproteobacteria bacterium]
MKVPIHTTAGSLYRNAPSHTWYPKYTSPRSLSTYFSAFFFLAPLDPQQKFHGLYYHTLNEDDKNPSQVVSGLKFWFPAPTQGGICKVKGKLCT